jgi:hypothetical protein
MKADRFLVMAHGTDAEVERAKTILASASPSRLEIVTGAKVADPV